MKLLHLKLNEKFFREIFIISFIMKILSGNFIFHDIFLRF